MGVPVIWYAYQYCRTSGAQRTGRIEYDDAEMVVEWLRYEMDGLNHLRIDEVYDADSNGELEDPSATGDAWRVQRVYVNGPGQLGQIAKVIVFTYASATTNTVASEDVYYYHYDILGNVSVISDPNGDEADQFEQDAFGNFVSGSWTTRIGGITEQITTKPYDADLGLYYFNARWYDPQVGAFVSRDPLNVKGGDPYVSCANRPTDIVDPTGLMGGAVPTLGYAKGDAEAKTIKLERCFKKALERKVLHLAASPVGMGGANFPSNHTGYSIPNGVYWVRRDENRRHADGSSWYYIYDYYEVRWGGFRPTIYTIIDNEIGDWKNVAVHPGRVSSGCWTLSAIDFKTFEDCFGKCRGMLEVSNAIRPE